MNARGRAQKVFAGGLIAGKSVSYRDPHYDEKDGISQLYIESVDSVFDWTFDASSEYLGEGVP